LRRKKKEERRKKVQKVDLLNRGLTIQQSSNPTIQPSNNPAIQDLEVNCEL
jgi:hypothetical protein